MIEYMRHACGDWKNMAHYFKPVKLSVATIEYEE